MLDDAVMGVGQTDLLYTEKCHKAFEKNDRYVKPRFVKDALLQTCAHRGSNGPLGLKMRPH